MNSSETTAEQTTKINHISPGWGHICPHPAQTRVPVKNQRRNVRKTFFETAISRELSD